ncbi:thymidylate kinase [Obba rivulosa]|uniref:Thymidylate kinase n=1 Tax=Obba rivulosa TaxID=1052685 RepID=A0A8E2DHG2_9APHY|nr:thymidylate kinase [Obba rivulosa]
MPEVTKRGAFVVIEGLDRSGKSTQCTLLLEQLRSAGVDVKLLKVPDRTTTIGKVIDSYLRKESELDDRAIHLLFSANRWEVASSIESSLRAGTLILCDRYAFSGLAFSSAQGLPYTWCRAPDAGLPAPDITLLLDVSPEAQAKRGGFGAERYEQTELQERVRAAFERVGDEMGGGGRWVVVDADAEQEAVARELWRHVEPLAQGTDEPLRRLWDEEEERRRVSELYL